MSDRIGTPYKEAHMLLNLTGASLAEVGFSLAEHNRLWEEFYPPVDEEARVVLDITCRGRKVPEHLVQAARHEDPDEKQEKE